MGLFSFAPELTVADGSLVLSWLEQTTTPAGETHHQLLVSRLETEGWSKPSWVASGADFFANWADTPSVSVAGDGTLFAHWLAKTDEETYAYSVFMARSDDAGQSWQPLGTLNDDSTPTEHGFVSYVPEDDGVRAFWLDGRQMMDGGDMNLRTARVGLDIGQGEVLDDRVCECCSTSAVGTDRGALVVFRDRSEGEIRDIGRIRELQGDWSESAAVAEDGWRIEGCPVNGPEVAASDNLVAVVWFTAAGRGPKVQVAFSEDSGETFGPARIIDNGRPLGRVDLVWGDSDSVFVSWLEGGDGAAEVHLRRLSASGQDGEPEVVARTSPSRASGFPRLERVGEDLYLAWVDIADEQSSRVRLLEIPVGSVG